MNWLIDFFETFREAVIASLITMFVETVFSVIFVKVYWKIKGIRL